MSNPHKHMEGILRAFAMDPEERMKSLMSSPYWELNQKYRARTEERNFNRRLAYQKEQIELTKKMIEYKTAQMLQMQTKLEEVKAQIEITKAETAKIKQATFMKNLKANAAIKEFTASLKAPVTAPVTAKPSIAAPAAHVPSKSAADVLQEMINKKYRLK